MHCVIREYKTTRANAPEIVDAARREFLPVVEAIPGFVSYSLSTTDDGKLISVSIFNGEAGAQKSIDAAAAWVGSSGTEAWASGPPRIISGPVLVRAVSDRTDETGAGLLRRFKVAPGTDVKALAESVRTGIVPILQSNDEFLSYAFIDSCDEHVTSLTAFASEAAVRDSHERSMQWINENLSSIVQGKPEVTIGKIALRRLAPHPATVG